MEEFQRVVQTGSIAQVTAFLDADPEAAKLTDGESNSVLHIIAESGVDPDIVAKIVALDVDVNAANKAVDTPLHVAARKGNVLMCEALIEAGADPLRRNGKNRIPGNQLKLSEDVKTFLQEAEEKAKEAKAAKAAALWDEKMKATQTESAFVLRCV